MRQYYYRILISFLSFCLYFNLNAILPLAAIWVGENDDQKDLYFGLLIDKQYIILDSDIKFYNVGNLANIKITFPLKNKLTVFNEDDLSVYKIKKHLNIGEFTFSDRSHTKVIIFKLDRPVVDLAPVEFSKLKESSEKNYKINFLSYLTEKGDQLNISKIDATLSNLPVQNSSPLFSFIKENMQENIFRTSSIKCSVPKHYFKLGCFNSKQQFVGWPFYQQKCKITLRKNSLPSAANTFLPFSYFYILNANYIRQKIKEDQNI